MLPAHVSTCVSVPDMDLRILCIKADLWGSGGIVVETFYQLHSDVQFTAAIFWLSYVIQTTSAVFANYAPDTEQLWLIKHNVIENYLNWACEAVTLLYAKSHFFLFFYKQNLKLDWHSILKIFLEAIKFSYNNTNLSFVSFTPPSGQIFPQN